MTLVPATSQGTGSGTVTDVTAADPSIVVGGTPSIAVTVATASLAVIAAQHASAGAITASAQKVTNLANGSAAGDAAAFGQIVPVATVTAAGDLIVGTGNATVGRLAVGATGTVLGGGATPAYVKPPGTELGYVQTTSDFPVTDILESTGTPILTFGSIAFDGGPVMLEFFCQAAQPPTTVAGFLIVTLWEGVTDTSRLAVVSNEVAAVSAVYSLPGRLRFTPTAANHTYFISAFVSATTGTPVLHASTGGTGGAPLFARILKV